MLRRVQNGSVKTWQDKSGRWQVDWTEESSGFHYTTAFGIGFECESDVLAWLNKVVSGTIVVPRRWRTRR